MEDIKSEPLDFVKDFQEYLTQQTQHVNSISGSFGGEKESESFQTDVTEREQNGVDHPSVEVSLEDSSGLLMDSFERTEDGKHKCSYCNYASKGIARLIEHIRIHTGEKPHRCHLCPFASAYERHLEAHMRSHTGEKPYKCDLCAFCCSDRSNLSHHRRRRHKLLPMRGPRSLLSNKKMLSALQKRTSSLGFSRRLFINFSPPSMVVQKSDYLSDYTNDQRNMHRNESRSKTQTSDENNRDAHSMIMDNPLNQLSTLAGQLANLPPDSQTPVSPDRMSCRDEKPILIPQASGAPVAVSTTEANTSTLADMESRPPGLTNYSPVAGANSEQSAHTTSASVSNSQPSTPVPGLTTQDHQLLQSCQHCDTYFSDNILYTIHMGCHGYENPFQCNICGVLCRDKYDFACHFARGQHK